MSFNLNIFAGAKDAWQYRSEPEEIRVLSVFFWRTLLVLAFIIVLCALWFGFQELGAVSDAETVMTTTQNAAPPLNLVQLGSTLDFFSGQQAQYQSLSNSPLPAVADPSK